MRCHTYYPRRYVTKVLIHQMTEMDTPLSALNLISWLLNLASLSLKNSIFKHVKIYSNFPISIEYKIKSNTWYKSQILRDQQESRCCCWHWTADFAILIYFFFILTFFKARHFISCFWYFIVLSDWNNFELLEFLNKQYPLLNRNYYAFKIFKRSCLPYPLLILTFSLSSPVL